MTAAPAFDLTDQRVLVVGASSGIGLAVARLAHGLGAHVVMASRTADRLVEASTSVGERTTAVPTDALDEDAVSALFDAAGDVDHVLVTAVADENALRSPLREMPTETARRGLDKLWTSFFTAREAARRMTSGSITLTSSASVFRPSRGGGIAMMSAASGAVAVLGRSLAAELAPVRVNVLVPGVVGSGVWSDEEREGLASWAADALPVAHLGSPPEVAHAVLFLMTNPYVTGVSLPVDGGLLVT